MFLQRHVHSFCLQGKNKGSFVALKITPLSPLCQSEKVVREGSCDSSRDSGGACESVHFSARHELFFFFLSFLFQVKFFLFSYLFIYIDLRERNIDLLFDLFLHSLIDSDVS